MSTISKTAGTQVLALQSVAASTVLLSAALDVSTKLAATMFIHFGRRAATAAGAGVKFRIEASSKATLDGHWYPLVTLLTDFASAEAEAVNGACAAGQPVVPVASTSNLTIGDLIYIDNTTIALSEWGRMKALSAGVSVTIEDNLLNAQTGATLYDRAEIFAPIQLDLTAVSRLRLVVDGASFTQAFAVEAHMVTGDSIAS